MDQQLSKLWERLQDPEYLHLILGEIPLYGVFFGVIFFIAALFFKSQQIQVMALVTIAAASLLTNYHVSERQRATPGVTALQTSGLQTKFKEMTSKRESSRWVYWMMAGLAAFCFMGKKSKFAATAVTLTIIWGVITVVFGTWLHMRDSEIRQPNIMLDPAAEAKEVQIRTAAAQAAKKGGNRGGNVVKATLPVDTNPTGH